MSRVMITQLREERASLFAQMRELTEQAEAEQRDLTGEEYQQYERLEGDFDSRSRRVERLEREEGLALGAQSPTPVLDEPPEARDDGAVASRVNDLYARIHARRDGESAALELRDLAHREGVEDLRRRALSGDSAARRLYVASDEYRHAFEAMVRTMGGQRGPLTGEQRAAYAIGAGGTGGYTVPAEFYNQLIVRLREFGVVRQLARVITTGGNGDLSIPRVAATRASATWVAEAGPYVASEDTFEQVVLKAYKAAVIAKASEEMVADSAFDVLGWIATSSGEALGVLENTAFQVGASGSTTSPEGLMTKATVGVTLTTGQTLTITSPDSLIDLYHSVPAPYRPRASWLMNDTTIKIIRKFKEATTNAYMWQPGIQAGQPDTILGRPVYADPDIAVPAANALTVAFGDIGAAYMIRDVEGVSAQVLSELYAANGQIGFRVHKRVDGDLVDDAAVRTLKHSAA